MPLTCPATVTRPRHHGCDPGDPRVPTPAAQTSGCFCGRSWSTGRWPAIASLRL